MGSTARWKLYWESKKTNRVELADVIKGISTKAYEVANAQLLQMCTRPIFGKDPRHWSAQQADPSR